MAFESEQKQTKQFLAVGEIYFIWFVVCRCCTVCRYSMPIRPVKISDDSRTIFGRAY